ncbi:hypothetical protein LWI28_022727 [Acer negundo]|uniref:Myb/SANT-like domain-containing protein n=1 Tax=Acer negundo TaxID=4023 RepID=A0AAD5IBB7_ACENE|nr:hypothetical protein LWI28_022727 [Acer negundo]
MSSSSTSKAKASWTPAFHEIFIDICLDQKLKGNKPGTHFTKEGWRNIIESFYDKTGLRYEKKQMKNHWDSSKEQWKVWCKLIEASSMKWDPKTSTFGASDEEWTNFIQANPETAQFRFKELQNTDKLNIIFNDTINSGDTEVPTQRKRQNVSSATSLLHTKGPSTGKAPGQNKSPSDAVVVFSRHDRQPASEQRTTHSKPKATWTPGLHEIFVDICIDETLKGNKPGTHFTKEGWRNIVESFQERTGLKFDRIQLKNHWDLTKEQWKIWCKLIDTSHMKWDPNSNKFGATEEDWENYIKANPEAVQFRYKELQSTEKLEIIFDRIINTGEIDHTTQRRKLNDDSTSPRFHTNKPDTMMLDRKSRRLDDSPTTSFLNIDEQGTAELDSRTEHLYDVESGSAVTIQRSFLTFQPTQSKLNYSIGECIECLDRMEEVEQGSSLYLFALDLFLKKEYREIFLQLKNPNVRMAWLRRLQSFSPPLE